MKEMVDILEIDTEEKPKLKVNYFLKFLLLYLLVPFMLNLSLGIYHLKVYTM